MKDKLLKLNRKARYYRIRNGLFGFAFATFIALGIALPVAAKAQADAEAARLSSESSEVVLTGVDVSTKAQVALYLE